MALAIVDTTIAETNSTAVTSASHSIAAGNGASLTTATNGADTNPGAVTLSVTGSHTFTQRSIASNGTAGFSRGCAATYTLHNSGGTTGTTTVTQTANSGTGTSFTILEWSGMETTFNGATAIAQNSRGSSTVTGTITVAGSESCVVAASDDWSQTGDYTAGTGETLDNTYNLAGQYSAGQWHSTSLTLGAGSYTSDAAGSTTREWELAMCEVRAAAGAGVPTVAEYGGYSQTPTRGPTRVIAY